ncbi:MAG TPA: phosphatidylserine/phosphatidylglycerophosphate/cardiolipin synthase family protein [Calditrichia bacterium]|nr:phosphatidylserine/phosphatidylglycerophosphate/cardiolipin synthase family protein [Calditrichia bacterium]
MKLSLLVDSPAFWHQCQRDIENARQSVYVQTLSFEGDSAGRGLSDLLIRKQLPDTRILVDSFTRYIINDRFLPAPANRRDPDLQAEVRATHEMIRELRKNNVQVQFTNPAGLLMSRFLSRNHKKLVLVDGHIAYIGGINFSDHNFDWHDLMLRIEDEAVGQFLEDDFLNTWIGKNIGASRRFPELTLHCFDGSTNRARFGAILEMIDNARESIFIESPYLSFPFYGRLGKARRRGVKVTIVSPQNNNKESLGKYTRWECARAGLDLHLYQKGMTPLKAMLVDGKQLVLGSSNFDYLSYTSHQETAVVVKNREIIEAFTEQVMKPDLAASLPDQSPVRPASGYLRHFAMRTLGPVAVLLAKRP